MAKIRKCKLSWEASASESVVGYKLYWSKGTGVDYDSRCIKIGNVTEIALPDDVTLSDGPVMFGVTAVDRDGNESDMITIEKPYRLTIPEAPAGLSIRPSEEFKLVGLAHRSEEMQGAADAQTEPPEHEDPLAQAIEEEKAIEEENSNPLIKMKRYSDTGHNRPPESPPE